jgi:hypothetical protein
MTCSSSCSTKRIKSTKEGMCWSPMWAWFDEYATWRDHNLVVLIETNRWRDVLISNVDLIEQYAMWRADVQVVLSETNRRRDVLISNVDMIEDCAMWHAHDHVVLSESNQRRKGCVDVQCGHDRGGVPDLSVSGDKSDLVVVDRHDPTTTSKPEAPVQSLNQLPMVSNLVGARSAWSRRSIPVHNRRTNKNLGRAILMSLEVES